MITVEHRAIGEKRATKTDVLCEQRNVVVEGPPSAADKAAGWLLACWPLRWLLPALLACVCVSVCVCAASYPGGARCREES